MSVVVMTIESERSSILMIRFRGCSCFLERFVVSNQRKRSFLWPATNPPLKVMIPAGYRSRIRRHASQV